MFPLQPSDDLVLGPNLIVAESANMISFGTTKQTQIRRTTRRDVERKRRQHMSTLLFSLQSLLPLDQNKGRRSVCDQVQKAVNHIKQMQKNIHELRDKLKVLSGTKIECDDLPNCVTVNLVQDGLEILIKNSNFGLSKVLAELVEKELDVTTSVSTRTKGGFLHKIQVEAKEMTSLDVSVLQNRLTYAMIK